MSTTIALSGDITHCKLNYKMLYHLYVCKLIFYQFYQISVCTRIFLLGTNSCGYTQAQKLSSKQLHTATNNLRHTYIPKCSADFAELFAMLLALSFTMTVQWTFVLAWEKGTNILLLFCMVFTPMSLISTKAMYLSWIFPNPLVKAMVYSTGAFSIVTCEKLYIYKRTSRCCLNESIL